MDKLNAYYEAYSEDLRLIKDNAHKTEFITTVNILRDFIEPDHKILDVGAGTGRFSFYLAEKGHTVTALEYAGHNVELMQDKLLNHEAELSLRILQGDGRDLSLFEDGCFDTVLCMGPIYHLESEGERRQCIEECLRVLKNGGFIAISYINKFASFMEFMKRDKEFIKNRISESLIDYGYMHGDDRDIFYFTSPSDIEELLKTFGVEIIINAATDGIGYLLKDIVNELDEEGYDRWLDYHMKTCSEPSLLGYSMHGLLLCRKPVR